LAVTSRPGSAGAPNQAAVSVIRKGPLPWREGAGREWQRHSHPRRTPLLSRRFATGLAADLART